MPPTFIGFIESQQDVLLLLEASLRDIVPLIQKRLSFKEREAIGSGHVYIYDEFTSGIVRWTDGKKWSPSRILGNFLIYKEVGTSTLMKKTINATYGRTVYHLVAYYNEADLVFNRLEKPTDIVDFQRLITRPGMSISVIGNKKPREDDQKCQSLCNQNPNVIQRETDIDLWSSHLRSNNQPFLALKLPQNNSLQSSALWMPMQTIHEALIHNFEADNTHELINQTILGIGDESTECQEDIARYLQDALDDLTRNLKH